MSMEIVNLIILYVWVFYLLAQVHVIKKLLQMVAERNIEILKIMLKMAGDEANEDHLRR